MIKCIIMLIIAFVLIAGLISGLSTGGMPVIGEICRFGRYKQDSKTSNEQQPIQWICLYADKVNNKYLLISKKCLDCKQYAIDVEKATWETSYIRKWLNDEFYNTAFNEQEKSRIVPTNVLAVPNSQWHTKGGNNTVDKVFLLSETEYDRYFDYQLKTLRPYRKAETTEYARNKETPNDDYVHDIKDLYKVSWWLRTPGNSLENALAIGTHGVLDYCRNGYWISSHQHVRPAIWVKKEEIKK